MKPAAQAARTALRVAGGVRAEVLRLLPVPLLILIDALVVAASVAAAVGIRATMEGYLDRADYLQLAPALGLLVAVYAAVGLYPGYGLGPVEELRRYAGGTTLVYLTLAAATFLFRGGAAYSRLVLLISWGLCVVALPVMRACVRSMLASMPWWGERVVILGAGETGRLLVRGLVSRPDLGLKPVAILDDDPGRADARHDGVAAVGGLELAPSFASYGRARHAVVCMPGVTRQRLTEILEKDLQGFPRVSIVPDLFGVPSLGMAARDLQGILALEIRRNLLQPIPRYVKRLIDVGLALVGLAVTAPLLALVALAIVLDSRGPVLFAQPRVGRGGRVFRAWKFRTMVVGAEAMLEAYLASHPRARAHWARHRKLPDDPRVTRVGKWLRRTSLDELPQLWNVLRGEMSLVGPRPLLPDEVPEYGEGLQLYVQVRPGLTGLWQVSGRADATFEDRARMDAYYVRNWSVWLDVYLLGVTVPAVVRGEGAY
ncbi:undecaprenyl-phosphate galactose phosphotransferase WbaP [Carboxydochorda subterranea]|uniref:Undecaprenyl-phosphate galactose phosphotransferase WbaP n=1 Tax=Carboxydichorda subterranea TaxID=3109565 RepID=A0ABZ1C141_9FIRM|nr:undecaprenyl-phosphate galactose phosphotransferase WbaP [Limnochorda sp. L945t]WRP18664.1 undecaprenyl-phosphate galactose phosphotransferase WbaP [Limnochorda sp. L945t]